MAKPRPSRQEYGIISVRHVDLNLWRDVAIFAMRRGLTLGDALNGLLSLALPLAEKKNPIVNAKANLLSKHFL